MAEKRRFLDVWLVESNTVYREVPYTVVTDWIEQSRILADDMVRPSGTADWFKVGGSPEFSAYLPTTQPYEVQDEAAALEPVEIDFGWKKSPHEGDDDDVDMIPLIDISLVLLIFFIMTSVASPTTSNIKTPFAVNGLVIDSTDMLVIGINYDTETNEPIFTFSAKRRDEKKQNPSPIQAIPAVGEIRSRDDFLAKVSDALKDVPENTFLDVSLEGHKDVPAIHIRETISGLDAIAAQRSIRFNKYISVSEPQTETPEEQ